MVWSRTNRNIIMAIGWYDQDVRLERRTYQPIQAWSEGSRRYISCWACPRCSSLDLPSLHHLTHIYHLNMSSSLSSATSPICTCAVYTISHSSRNPMRITWFDNCCHPYSCIHGGMPYPSDQEVWGVDNSTEGILSHLVRLWIGWMSL